MSAELTGALLAGSARSPGLSRLVSNLLTHPEDQEFYRLRVPPDVVGKTVSDALAIVKGGYDAMFVGVVNGLDGYDLNPPGDRVLVATDVLLVIASHIAEELAVVP